MNISSESSSTVCSPLTPKPYKQLNFSLHEEERLIELVRSYFYEPKTKTTNKVSYWNLISRELDRPIADCKLRWKAIRDYYIKQKRGIKSFKKSTDALGPTRGVDRFHLLTFLDGTFAVKRACEEVRRKRLYQPEPMDVTTPEESHKKDEYLLGLGNEVAIGDHVYIVQLQHSEKTESAESNRDVIVNSTNGTDVTIDTTESVANHRESPKRLIAPRESIPHLHQNNVQNRVQPKREDTTMKEVVVSCEKQLDELSDSQIRASEAVDSAVDMFFKSIAATVKTFPPKLVVEAKMKVCNIIAELEYKAINEQRPS